MTTDRKQQIEMLFRKHYRAMYRLAKMLLHDDDESKDIVHDVFAQLLDKGDCLREDTGEAYLMTCVRNKCLNVIRDKEIQERVRNLYRLDMEKGVAPTDSLEQQCLVLQHFVDAMLPPQNREVILLHFYEGLTFQEIAHRLCVSETTVYKYLRRALGQLRTQFKNH